MGALRELVNIFGKKVKAVILNWAKEYPAFGGSTRFTNSKQNNN